MKRLAVLLAAAALVGTGCGDHTCSRDVTLDWSAGFTTADGDVVGCSSTNANVQRVDVFVNDGFAASFDCAAGQGTVRMVGGSNLVTVEGVAVGATAALDAIIYRDEFSTDSTCNSKVIAAQPGEGRVSLAYTFSPVNVCFSPGPRFIWVRVRDDIAGQIAADSRADPTQFTCGDAVSFRLASGSYTLLDTEERIFTGATYVPVATDCVDRAFTVNAGPPPTPLSVVLTDSPFACP